MSGMGDYVGGGAGADTFDGVIDDDGSFAAPRIPNRGGDFGFV